MVAASLRDVKIEPGRVWREDRLDGERGATWHEDAAALCDEGLLIEKNTVEAVWRLRDGVVGTCGGRRVVQASFDERLE